jgi:hypothetical protein
MYIGDGEIVEAPGGAVRTYPISDWYYPSKTWVAVLRVTTADPATRSAAIDFALGQLGDPFDSFWFWRQANGDSWYCSELVWAAYLNASDGDIDLSRWPIGPVSPSDLYADPDTTEVSWHYEEYPEESGFIFKAKSPVDLEVVDPDGRLISKDTSEIPGAIYAEYYEDGEGSPEDWIGIPERMHGQYSVTVIAEAGASPTDTYTLEVQVEDGTTTTLAEDVQVADIPDEPYVYTSSLAVGGIAELPLLEPDAALQDAGPSDPGAASLFAYAAMATAGVIGLAAAAWHVRKRWF